MVLPVLTVLKFCPVHETKQAFELVLVTLLSTTAPDSLQDPEFPDLIKTIFILPLKPFHSQDKILWLRFCDL